MSKNYQRKHLRAPYWQHILFVDEGHVHKGKGLNISQGGLLLHEIGHLPKGGEVQFLIYLPEFPLFKNYNLEKVQSFNPDNFIGQTIRFSAKHITRGEKISETEGVFMSKIAFEINQISKVDSMKLSRYVDNLSSNLIHLQVLLDNLNSDETNLLRLRKIASYFGHSFDEKISVLKHDIEHDYKSLQWL